jgi:hypothetical protein
VTTKNSGNAHTATATNDADTELHSVSADFSETANIKNNTPF